MRKGSSASSCLAWARSFFGTVTAIGLCGDMEDGNEVSLLSNMSMGDAGCDAPDVEDVVDIMTLSASRDGEGRG